MKTCENIITCFGKVLAVILCYPLYFLPFCLQLILWGFLRHPVDFKPNLISTMPTPWFVVLMVFLAIFQIYLFVAMADSNHYQKQEVYWGRTVLLLFTGFDYDYVYDEKEYLLKQFFNHLPNDRKQTVELNWNSVMKEVLAQDCEEITERILKDMIQKFSLSENEKENLKNTLKNIYKEWELMEEEDRKRDERIEIYKKYLLAKKY